MTTRVRYRTARIVALRACTTLVVLTACTADAGRTPDTDDIRSATDTVGTALGDSVRAPAPPAGVEPGASDSITLVFTRDEQPVQVRRGLAGTADLRTALDLLVRGPTAAERAAGLWSWFSDATRDAVAGVSIDAAGHATVDFRDLRQLIPNASTSAGSAVLLHELNGTVFQFPSVRSVQYRIEGDCEAFWNWLQYDCETVTR
jgi:hypothetical protein